LQALSGSIALYWIILKHGSPTFLWQRAIHVTVGCIAGRK
jgi:hypothetical protein